MGGVCLQMHKNSIQQSHLYMVLAVFVSFHEIQFSVAPGVPFNMCWHQIIGPTRCNYELANYKSNLPVERYCLSLSENH